MYQFIGKYFDGKSSQSQIVEVFFDGGFDELMFKNENLEKIWYLKKIVYENYGDLIEIRQEEKSSEFLTVDDKDFKEQLLNYLRKKDKMSVYQELIHQKIGSHLAIAAAILAVIVLGYLFAVPYIAEKSVALIPETFDDKIGDSFIGEFILKNKQDTAKTLLLNEFAQEIDLNNKKELNFRVINSSMVNAFALPNGEIVIFTGLLEKMDDYTELAALIGHEVAHVNNRHSMKMLCKNLAGYIFISALFADVNGVIAVIADNAHNLNTLSYSRTFETEADEQAVYLMVQNNINPQGVVSLFKIIDEETKYEESKLFEFAQTHPLTSHRLEKIQKIISKNNFSFQNNQKLKSLFEKMTKEKR